jgi:hypothetical protein
VLDVIVNVLIMCTECQCVEILRYKFCSIFKSEVVFKEQEILNYYLYINISKNQSRLGGNKE